MADKIDLANKIGSLFNSWSKIILGTMLVIVGAAGAYYQIFQNKDNILIHKVSLDKSIDDVREDLLKEIKLLKKDLKDEQKTQSGRSDKRYSRAMRIGEDHEARMRRLEYDLTYIKGKEGY